MAATKAFVSRVWDHFMSSAGHDANVFRNASFKIVSATPGQVRAEMQVSEHQVNRLKTLHGGLTSTLVDTMGSLALASKGLYMTGVTTDIHVTFVRAAKLGETVNVTSEVIGQGKTLAYTRIQLESGKTGKMLAFGSHTKYIQDALKSEENVTFSEDGENVLSGKRNQSIEN